MSFIRFFSPSKLFRATFALSAVLTGIVSTQTVHAQTAVAAPQDGNASNADYSRIATVPRREIDSWLKQQLHTSGADPSKGRYRFVLGFSTGHYATDPVQAIATRRVAFGLLNNTCATGDHVIPVAWEMSIWSTEPEITLSADPQSRARIVSKLPYTPMPNTVGGHDTERALYDVLTRVVSTTQAPSTVILLFTNSGQSQVGDGSHAHLFGQSNPQLLERLKTLGYRAPERTAFTAHASNGGKDIPLHVIGLFPQHMTALPGEDADTPRYPTFSLGSWQPQADRPASVSDLPNPTQSDLPSPRPTVVPKPEERQDSGGINPLIYGVGAFLLIGILVAVLRKRSGSGASSSHSTPAPAQGRPIPGRLVVTFGVGGSAQTLSPLYSTQVWRIEAPSLTGAGTASGNSPDSGKPTSPVQLREVKDDRPAPADALLLAMLQFEPTADRKDWNVLCTAAPGYQFGNILAMHVDQSDPRRLKINAAGGDFRADISNPSAGSPLTFKVRYEAR